MTSAEMAATVEAEDMRLIPAGPMGDVVLSSLEQQTGLNPLLDPTALSVAEYFAGTRVDLSADEALAAAKSWAPDLVVSEVTDFLGPLVAATQGVQLATLLYGPSLPAAWLESMTTVLGGRFRDRGLPAPAQVPTGRWLLDTCPPGLQVDGILPAAGHISLRPEPYRPLGAPTGPSPSTTTSSSPKVLVTFGTIFGNPEKMSPMLRALSALDIDIVATLGFAAQESDFDVDPDRVSFTPFAPFAELLNGVSAIVCHGGAGTTLSAMSRGIPMVILPQGAEQFIQAERVSAAGAGLAPASELGPRGVVDAVVRLLSEPTFTAAAHRIRDEIANMTSPADVARQLMTAL